MTTTVWAIADLHLSFAKPRDQTRYGEKWRDHEARIAAAWQERVAPEDIVLMPGDLSWAKKVRTVQPDLAWIARLPGHKVLARGNHDWWWRDLDQIRGQVLPEHMQAVQGSCLAINDVLVCGTMGHVAPNDPYFKSNKIRSYRRELNWLQNALKAAETMRTNGQPVMTMLHYPPFTSSGQPSGFTEMIRQYAPEVCVYGHLHFNYEWAVAVDEPRDGTCYHLVAADYLGMIPRRVWPPEV